MCAVSKRSEAILAFVVGFLIVTFCVGCGSTSANFASTTPGPQTWSISGTLSPATSGTGATVSVTGASATTVTADANGNYSFSGLANGSYTVTPSKTGVNFSPTSQNVSVNGASHTGVNFSIATVALQSITITAVSGSIAKGTGDQFTATGTF